MRSNTKSTLVLLFFALQVSAQTFNSAQILDSLRLLPVEKIQINIATDSYIGVDAGSFNSLFAPFDFTKKSFKSGGTSVPGVSDRDLIGVSIAAIQAITLGTRMGDEAVGAYTYLNVDPDSDNIAIQNIGTTIIGSENPLPTDGTPFAQALINNGGGVITLSGYSEVSFVTGMGNEFLLDEQGFYQLPPLTTLPNILTASSDGALINYERTVDATVYRSIYVFSQGSWEPLGVTGLPSYSDDSTALAAGLVSGEWYAKEYSIGGDTVLIKRQLP